MKYLITSVLIIMLIPIIGYTIEKVTYIAISILSTWIGSKAVNFISNRLTFIGTIHHELSHALVAICLGARVNELHPFKPTKDTLGEVKIATRGPKSIRRLQLGLAAAGPVIIGLITEYIIYRYICSHEISTIMRVILFYIQASVLIHMPMSKVDIKHYKDGIIPIWSITFIVCCITQFSLI